MRARSRRRAARCGSRAGPSIVITIDDDGPGIRPDAIDKIFERFYTDRPQQSFGQNSGLGLSISKQIVEAHGGHLTAQNRMAPAETPGGAGKSRLTLDLIVAPARGALTFARLVADDRVLLEARNTQLIARPPPALE